MFAEMEIKENTHEVDNNLVVFFESAGIQASIHLIFGDGRLYIWGKDIGDDVENYWGERIYFYQFTFDKENTRKLLNVCKGENKSLMEWLRYIFCPRTSCLEFISFCKRQNIDYSFRNGFDENVLQQNSKRLTDSMQ